ncbi:TonB-dependent receptor [Sphingomonas jatrophae]|uniref:Iron complex outermembrane recepter protein n=1 Tax=Sphingomonas jatrophae TaxID=1166337 RepID=A0A1I6KC13_9SPHN|nr:TonB-dependent receptor plug domain-containing protein [Sphingomonas jatrophae]SFR88759.1 iron complex outermembrane recepter protein [Sphingomonas jatrophae]
MSRSGRMRGRDRAVLLATIATIVPAASAAAAGQDAATAPVGADAPAPAGLEDIIVTARRRAEASQTVPVAVTSFSQQSLDNRHITAAQDLQGQVPSLLIGAAGQTRSTETFTLRGQGTTFLSSPGVVTYFAEAALVPGTFVSTQGPPGMLLDLSNIQVLRGPQGTLFGRNTTGGAILLEPARPTERAGGYLQGQIGNYRDREIEGVVNLPLVEDKLLVRAAGRFVDRRGYTKDVVTGRDYDNRHYYTGRLGITFRPAEGIENYLVAYGTRSSDNGTGYVLAQFNVPLLASRFATRGGCVGVGLGPNCSVLTALATAQQGRDERHVADLRNSYSKVRGWGVHDTLSIDLSDTLTLRNIASYGKLRANIGFDADGSPINIYAVRAPAGLPLDATWQWTEELQLQGNALADKLTYVVGGYADRSKADGPQGQLSNSTLLETTTLRDFDRKSYAVYAQGGFDFGALTPSLDGLKLTAGIRRTWDRSSGFGIAYRTTATGGVACANGVSSNPQTPADCALNASARAAATTWTAGIDYSGVRNLLLYAKASRGYKNGGINYSAVNIERDRFEPEYVKTYEAGFKSDLRLGTVPARLNLTAFKTKYRNIQRAGGDFNPRTFASGAIVLNAGSATINGIELEGQVAPARWFSLSGNYSYLDAGYDEFLFPVLQPTLDCSGRQVSGTANFKCMPFQFAPKHQFSLTGNLTLPLAGDAGELGLVVTYAHIDQQFTLATALEADEPGSMLEGYDLVNATLTWRDVMGAPVDASLFATNLFDKTYRTSNTNSYRTLGVQSTLYGEPRMYGVRLRYRWGS